MTSRLTQQDLRAISEALAARLAGALDEDETGIARAAYESARAKIQARLNRNAKGHGQ